MPKNVLFLLKKS